jgi:arabinose-5-phosphate isomerase
VRDGRLTGVVTDGDLRRNMAGLMDRRPAEIATRTPRTIAPDALIGEAVAEMNAAKVISLCVVEPDGRLIGLIRLHDCLRAGVL